MGTIDTAGEWVIFYGLVAWGIICVVTLIATIVTWPRKTPEPELPVWTSSHCTCGHSREDHSQVLAGEPCLECAECWLWDADQSYTPPLPVYQPMPFIVRGKVYDNKLEMIYKTRPKCDWYDPQVMPEYLVEHYVRRETK